MTSTVSWRSAGGVVPGPWRRMNVEIEVRNVFHVKGRGAVAIGYLRQGIVRVGQQTRSLALGAGPHRVLTLAAVETVHAHDGGASALGLVFRERPSLEDLRAVLTPGTVLQFEDTTGPDAGTA
jgi:translation elongation factor EF-Tu-like GTPase